MERNYGEAVEWSQSMSRSKKSARAGFPTASASWCSWDLRSQAKIKARCTSLPCWTPSTSCGCACRWWDHVTRV